MSFLVIACSLAVSRVTRTRHFEATKAPASYLARRRGWVEFLDTLSVRVVLDEGRSADFTVVHLSAGAPPSTRRDELHACSHHFEGEVPSLVAGDFNCFSNPLLALLLAGPLAYRAEDMFCFEQRRLLRWFSERGFRAGARGVTVPRLRMQFDHIFCRDMQGVSGRVVKESFGSDHLPLFVTCDLS